MFVYFLFLVWCIVLVVLVLLLRRGLSFLCAYSCSSRRWVQAGGGNKGPLDDGNPAFAALKDLLRLVCRQVRDFLFVVV